jgi:hypothetical protein
MSTGLFLRGQLAHGQSRAVITVRYHLLRQWPFRTARPPPPCLHARSGGEYWHTSAKQNSRLGAARTTCRPTGVGARSRIGMSAGLIGIRCPRGSECSFGCHTEDRVRGRVPDCTPNALSREGGPTPAGLICLAARTGSARSLYEHDSMAARPDRTLIARPGETVPSGRDYSAGPSLSVCTSRRQASQSRRRASVGRNLQIDRYLDTQANTIRMR